MLRTDLTPKTHYFAYFAHRAKATALRMHHLGCWQQLIIEHVLRDRTIELTPTPGAPAPAAIAAGAGSAVAGTDEVPVAEPSVDGVGPQGPSSVTTGGAGSVVTTGDSQAGGACSTVRSQRRWTMFATAKQLGLEKRRVQRNLKRKARDSKVRAAALRRYLLARRVVESIRHQKDVAQIKRSEKKAQKKASEGKESKAQPGIRRPGGENEGKRGGGKRARGSGGEELYRKDTLAADDEGGERVTPSSKRQWWCEDCEVVMAMGSKSYHVNKSKKHKESVRARASRSKPD